MICPHCEYVYNEYDFEKNKNIQGTKGAFYVLPVEMKRDANYYNDIKQLFGCPECKKTFIN